ncbi:PilN domain-containing protein [Xylophilus ampelinus]|uniref:General secretion pathway protein L n=1 Tax=Xylophilus ampelinus TaxID=54067 RepID=A0A318SKK9_9BURK|nr:PilN domain-containing protein [Xylophilus ampelinus]MCS4510975.1 PilN domain-containing protein [Xylophilus ampelinus]PYE76032.1 general secretion pathway protein L [Xylophilus ampelinus]
MTRLSQDFKLFGLDLGSGMQGLASVVGSLLRGPPFTWMSAAPLVQVLRADGTVDFWQDGRPVAQTTDKTGVRPSFSAVEIPDAYVLRHTSSLPAMPLAQISEALLLEVQSISPFAATNLVWGWCMQPQGPGRLHIDVALASRNHVTRTIKAAAANTSGCEPESLEAWVMPTHVQTGRPIVLQGFGEGARLQDGVRKQRRVYGLLALSAALLVVLVLTPSVQLWLRARQADAAFAEVQQRTRPVVALRERYVRSTDRLKGVAIAVGESAAPLKVLKLLTDAFQDDTFVQTVQIDGTKVSVTGSTDNAAALMTRLASTAGVMNLKATQAATRQTGAAKESFGIEFQLEIAGLPERAASTRSAVSETNPAAAAASSGLPQLAPTDNAEVIYPKAPTVMAVPSPAAPPASLYSRLAPAEQTPAPVGPPPAPSADGSAPPPDPLGRASIGGRGAPPPAPNPAP